MNKINEISDVLSRTTDKKLIKDFFTSLLTENEIDKISLRWELVKQLDKGISQRNIGKKLNISLCKITRGSKELKKPNSAFRKLLKIYYKKPTTKG